MFFIFAGVSRREKVHEAVIHDDLLFIVAATDIGLDSQIRHVAGCVQANEP